VVLAYLPSPSQGVWHLGPLPIRAYALCIIAGIIVALIMTQRRWTARGGDPEAILDVALWAVPFGIVGGRLYHLITDPELYFTTGKDPIKALYIWDGGLGIWGAVALGAVGAWIGCRRRGISLLAFGDALAPGLIVAQALGRWGNYFNQELYGAPTTLPWALGAGHRSRPPPGGHPRHRALPPHIPLRMPLGPRRRAAAALGRSPVHPAPRQALRPVRRRLHPRPRLGRSPAGRSRQPLPRAAPQRLDLADRLPHRPYRAAVAIPRRETPELRHAAHIG